ncbi:MAG: FAD-binding oxidoreductase [Burkholderiaceae bacterium]
MEVVSGGLAGSPAPVGNDALEVPDEPPVHRAIAVAGAGIVGLCAALILQREGHAVTVYDPLPPGGGASFGNAGLLSIDSCVPIALPGMLREVPRWLSDSQGPLALKPAYALRALPWLLRWIRAGRMPQVRAASDALCAMHETALDQYRALLGPSHFSELIRTTGQVHVWEGEHEGAGDRIARELRDRHGIPTEPLDADQLHEMIPQLSPRIRRGLFFPRNGHTVGPQRMVQVLAALLEQAGGRLRHEKVLKIIPQSETRYRVLTNVGDRVHDGVVVACGAWSRELLAPLGTSIPLDTERGYHVSLQGPSFDLPIPVVHKDRGFAATAMETGLRIAGTVEIGGLELPPDERRANALLHHAQSLFPSLRFQTHSMWMGFRPSMPDSLPVIDRVPNHPGIFVACGHGHFGMTAAPMTGRLLARLVQGRTPEIDPLPYRISRF